MPFDTIAIAIFKELLVYFHYLIEQMTPENGVYLLTKILNFIECSEYSCHFSSTNYMAFIIWL